MVDLSSSKKNFSAMVSDLKLLPRYLLNLGLISGLYTFIQVEILSLHKIRLKGYDHPIFLRPGTTDKKVFREIFLFKIYNFKIQFTPACIVDGGANIGLSSIFFGNRYKDCIIYAVEPDHGNFNVLKNNIKPYKNIIPIQSAAWNKEVFLKIKNKNEHAWAFTVQESTETDPDSFPAISLTTLMKKHGIQQIDILKLDVEGSECEIFSENYDYWLSNTKILVVELHDWLKPGSSKSLFSAISNYNFKTEIYEGMLILTNLDLP